MNDLEKKKLANTMLFAGTILNFFIGVLYAWSELKKHFMATDGWEWSSTQAGLPYTLAILCFAMAVVLGGRVQDKIGPRWVLTAGGIFIGIGMVLSAMVGNSPLGVAICFGVIAGVGIGLSYSSSSPPALKWFHPSQKGYVNGWIVGGFGFAPLFYAPVVRFLLDRFNEQFSYDLSVKYTFFILGVCITIITCTVAQFIKNPPAGYTQLVPKKLKVSTTRHMADKTWKEMVMTKTFWLMTIMFLFSATVGLMLIANISNIAKTQTTMVNTAYLVSLMALVNGLGRLFGGIFSDKIGRTNMLYIVLTCQMVNLAGFSFYTSVPMLVIGVIVAGFCYGTFLSVFPSITGDQFGLKNFGINYGLVLLFWGMAGVLAPMFADFMYDLHGNFKITFIACASVMPILIGMNFLLKKEIKKSIESIAPEGNVSDR